MGILDVLKPKVETRNSVFHESKPRKSTIVAHKGGVGKTTITLNLSDALAKKGKRVLVMDLDSQNNTGLFFGVQGYTGKIPTMSDVLYKNVTPDKAVIQVRPNFDLIQGDRNLGKFAMEKGMEAGIGLILKNIFAENEKFFSQYDYVFMDSSPSHSILHLISLLASDCAFIPFMCDFFSVNGVAQIKQTIDEVNQNITMLREYDPEGEYNDVEVGLIIANMLDRRMKSRVDKALDVIKEEYSGKLAATPIRVCSQLSDCPERHLLISELSSSSTGAEDFRLLAEEVINLV